MKGKRFQTISITLILIAISFSQLFGEVKLSKIYVSNKGQLEQVIISVNSYKIFLSNKGQMQKIVTEANNNLEYKYRVQDDKLEKVNYDELDYRFEKVVVKADPEDTTEAEIQYEVKERLYLIGGENIVYMPFALDRIESIGDLKFQYYHTGNGYQMITHIGDVVFQYRYPDYRLEYIGDASFEYYLLHNEKIKSVDGSVNYNDDIPIQIPTNLNFY
ncbi:MAG: hypothetical protein U9N76_05885 [Candidatus Marinimicrobia bacterium]|nr:hypothetical protein [Candidatus Neomarinimicrobiota bacterium]